MFNMDVWLLGEEVCCDIIPQAFEGCSLITLGPGYSIMVQAQPYHVLFESTRKTWHGHDGHKITLSIVCRTVTVSPHLGPRGIPGAKVL